MPSSASRPGREDRGRDHRRPARQGRRPTRAGRQVRPGRLRRRHAVGHRRAQHRLRGDVGPDLGDRRDRRARQDHGLRRRGVGWRVEVDRQRHDVQAVFDKQAVQSIGAIAIDPSNPRTIWVGTGESWTRNSVSDRRRHLQARTDERRDLDPHGPARRPSASPASSSTRRARNTVYACVPGKLWSDSDGPRRSTSTTNGGKTWSLVLKGANLVHRLLRAWRWTRRTRSVLLRRDVGLPAEAAGRSAPAATGRRPSRATPGSIRSGDGGKSVEAAHGEAAGKGLPPASRGAGWRW